MVMCTRDADGAEVEEEEEEEERVRVAMGEPLRIRMSRRMRKENE
jgi:hypothetical protein